MAVVAAASCWLLPLTLLMRLDPRLGSSKNRRFTSELSAQSVLPLNEGWRYAFLEARMQRKIFWMTFAALGLMADLLLPFWWAVGATVPILALSWWIAYRSDWF